MTAGLGWLSCLAWPGCLPDYLPCLKTLPGLINKAAATAAAVAAAEDR